MQKIANAPSDGVILGFAFRRCFRFLSATFLLIRTAIRQMAEIFQKKIVKLLRYIKKTIIGCATHFRKELKASYFKNDYFDHFITVTFLQSDK